MTSVEIKRALRHARHVTIHIERAFGRKSVCMFIHGRNGQAVDVRTQGGVLTIRDAAEGQGGAYVAIQVRDVHSITTEVSCPDWPTIVIP